MSSGAGCVLFTCTVDTWLQDNFLCYDLWHCACLLSKGIITELDVAVNDWPWGRPVLCSRYTHCSFFSKSCSHYNKDWKAVCLDFLGNSFSFLVHFDCPSCASEAPVLCYIRSKKRFLICIFFFTNWHIHLKWRKNWKSVQMPNPHMATLLQSKAFLNFLLYIIKYTLNMFNNPLKF